MQNPTVKPSPAIVAKSVTHALPLHVKCLFCMIYVLAGFVGRSPWRGSDSWTFRQMLQDTTHIPWHNITLWLGKFGMFLAELVQKKMGLEIGLGLAMASRLPFMVLLGLIFWLFWCSVFALAHTPNAQPVAFAFGGEAEPQAYARTVADSALLALMASLGFAQLAHETSVTLVQLFFSVVLFRGASVVIQCLSHPDIVFGFDSSFRKNGCSIQSLGFNGTLVWAGLIFHLGIFGLILTHASVVGVALGFFTLVILWLKIPVFRWKSVTLLLFVAPFLLWFCVILTQTMQISVASVNVVAENSVIPTATDTPILTSFFSCLAWFRLLLWFTWPVLPLAGWALWRWRWHGWQGHLHIGLPLLWFVSCIAAVALPVFLRNGVGLSVDNIDPSLHSPDRILLLGLPALATLAAFALPTLERRWIAWVDWFTLVFFSCTASVLWVAWLWLNFLPQTVWVRLLLNYIGLPKVPSVLFIWLICALIGTLAWLKLVIWRISKHRTALWKSMILPAAGTTLCWLLLTTLWMPILDFSRSYSFG